MSKLTISSGVSGSGKSTWAESVPGAVIVSRDALRVALFQRDDAEYYRRKDLRECEDYITKVEHAAILNGLKAGKHVISDNTNIEVKYMKPLLKIAYSVGAEVERKVFDVSLHTALSRNKLRAMMGGRDVPEDVIRKQHDRLQHTKNQPLPELPPLPAPYTGTPGKPKAFMYDLDGTSFHMNNKRGPYDLNVDVDDPDEVVLDVVVRLQDTGLIGIGMSGRKEAARNATERAFEAFGIDPPTHLFMRADNDNRSDNIIKAELFDTHVRDLFDVQFVIDDRWQVCEMWLSIGLKVFNVSGLDRGEF